MAYKVSGALGKFIAHKQLWQTNTANEYRFWNQTKNKYPDAFPMYTSAIVLDHLAIDHWSKAPVSLIHNKELAEELLDADGTIDIQAICQQPYDSAWHDISALGIVLDGIAWNSMLVQSLPPLIASASKALGEPVKMRDNGLILLTWFADPAVGYVHRSVITSELTGSLAEMTAELASRVVATDSEMDVAREDADVKATAATLVRISLPLLAYTCADNIDIKRTELPPAVTKKQDAERAALIKRQGAAYNVGDTIGALITAFKQRGDSDPAGTTVRPHIRKGHFHTYRVGPGRAGRVVKYVHPMHVNAHIGAPTPTTKKVN